MVILTQRQQQKQLHKRNDDKENSKKNPHPRTHIHERQLKLILKRDELK